MDLIIVTALSCAVIGGAAVWAVTRRDLGDRRAALAGAGVALVTGLAFLMILYLAVLAVVAGVAGYLLARHRLRVNQAMLAGAASYALVALGGFALIGAALETM